MKTVFWDYTPRWVPFVAAAMVVVGVWVGGVWDNFEFAGTTKFAVGLACVLFVAIFFQGRYYWKNQVDRLSTSDNENYELTTMMWVGRGKRVAFGAHEATGWSASAATTKPGEPAKLSRIVFSVRGQEFDMSFVNPKAIDLEGLTAINPDYFAKVKADYPAFKSVSA